MKAVALDWELPSSIQGHEVHQTAVVPYMCSFPCQLSCTKEPTTKKNFSMCKFAFKTAQTANFFSFFFYFQWQWEPSPPVYSAVSVLQWKFNEQNQLNQSERFFVRCLHVSGKSQRCLANRFGMHCCMVITKWVHLSSQYRRKLTGDNLRSLVQLFLLVLALGLSALCSSLSLSFRRLALHHRRGNFPHLTHLDTLVPLSPLFRFLLEARPLAIAKETVI